MLFVPKHHRSYVPEQALLLPASLRDWLPDGRLAYFVSDLGDELDLSAIEAVYEGELRGQPPYDQRMMTKLLVYGYCTGVLSVRAGFGSGFRKRSDSGCWPGGGQPIADFRKIHLEALEGLFGQAPRNWSGRRHGRGLRGVILRPGAFDCVKPAGLS